jgi:hypothetical protein
MCVGAFPGAGQPFATPPIRGALRASYVTADPLLNRGF